MKTAMVKTDIWNDDAFYEMNIDTKLVYMLVLTAPERGVGRMYKMPDRIISARSGLSVEQINICKRQLQESQVVDFYDGWLNLTDKSSFVQPVKGKLTAITLERELADIPNDVLDHFVKITDEISPVKHTSVTRERRVHVNDNVHDSDNDLVNVSDKSKAYGKPEINELFDEWEKIVGYKITANKTKNRYSASNLLKTHGKQGMLGLMRGVNASQSDQYAPRVSDFVTLQQKANDLIAWGKRRTVGGKVVTV